MAQFQEVVVNPNSGFRIVKQDPGYLGTTTTVMEVDGTTGAVVISGISDDIVMDGDVVGTADDNSIANGAVTLVSMANLAANKVIGSIAGGVPEAIAMTAAGRAIAGAATDDAQAVLLHESLATAPVVISGVTVSQAVFFMSPVIDAFATPGTLTTIVPALGAGLRLVGVSFRALYVTRTGTITGSPIGKLGSNVAHDDLTASLTFASAAQLSLSNAGNTGNAVVASLPGTTNVNGASDLASALIFELTTAATGTATLTLRLGVTAYIAAF